VADYPDEGLALSDLIELVKGGAKIKIDRPAQRIAQFDELINLMKEMIATNRARIEADEARNKSQLEVLATLQSLIRSGNVTKSHPVDLTPLKTVLTQISENTKTPKLKEIDFVKELNIERSRQGYIDKIVPVYARSKH